MPDSSTTRYRGITIAAVKITRYQVRDATGKVIKTFAKAATARAYIDGYLRALERHAPEGAA